jgi:DNA-directed RNA polymerase specialized sigma24 family protein
MSERRHDIARLQAMDEGAWAALQDDYFRRIYFYVKRYVSDHQTAEDLTQDVFLGAVRGIAASTRVTRSTSSCSASPRIASSTTTASTSSC